ELGAAIGAGIEIRVGLHDELSDLPERIPVLVAADGAHRRNDQRDRLHRRLLAGGVLRRLAGGGRRADLDRWFRPGDEVLDIDEPLAGHAEGLRRLLLADAEDIQALFTDAG